jgi:hypothetical protein
MLCNVNGRKDQSRYREIFLASVFQPPQSGLICTSTICCGSANGTRADMERPKQFDNK